MQKLRKKVKRAYEFKLKNIEISSKQKKKNKIIIGGNGSGKTYRDIKVNKHEFH